mgnify:CR=1 FL=1
MSRKREHENAYSDGSREDFEYYAKEATRRRREINGAQATEKILWYLGQQVEVLEADFNRFRAAGDHDRKDQVRERINWTEAMIHWINHNV